ncbi:hypothetical protein N8739_00655 [Luminiphilus sp.]|nr:hypothetical protein [Luminiphilus sp.]
MTTKKTTTSRRKTLTPVQKLADKTPVTTAAVRKAAQAVSREELVANPALADHNDWVIKVARGELEAPAAVQALCLKELHTHLYGLEAERNKVGSDKVSITITGIGAPLSTEKDISPAVVTISSSSEEASDE